MNLDFRPLPENVPDGDISEPLIASEGNAWTRPPGIVGTIADFIYNAAPRPMLEAAIAGSLAYFAGIVGRAYNVTGMGLNQYIVLLAVTGAGKNGIKIGIDKLNAALQPLLPHGVLLRKGCSYIPSPQGLRNSIVGDQHNSPRLCCLSVLGEVGIWLQELCDKKASQNNKGLRRFMLDLYTSSGGSKTIGDSVYSDRQKDKGEIVAPAWSFVGDSTQHAFYKAVTEDALQEGLIPRFTIIEYPHKTLPKDNPAHNDASPSPELLNRLAGIARYVHEIEQHAESRGEYKWIDVPLTEAASRFGGQLSDDVRARIEKHNCGADEYLSDVWTRFYEKTLKIAALLAVGDNCDRPVINDAHMQWAHDLVMHGTKAIIDRFQSGAVGDNNEHLEQHRLLLNCLNTYRNKPWRPEYEKNYSVTEEMYKAHVVHYRYIYNMLHKRPVFKNAANTGNAIANIIREFVNADVLQEISRHESWRGNRTGLMYLIKEIKGVA